MMSICKLLKRMVPRVGVEPTRPYGQRILSPFRRCLPQSTTRYQAVFTDVSAVKASWRPAWYEHVSPSSSPHLCAHKSRHLRPILELMCTNMPFLPPWFQSQLPA